MTETSISLFSILIGITGALLCSWCKPKYSLAVTGNIIVGVFGSILFIKLFGRLGFAPNIITQSNHPYILLSINLLCSVLGSVSLLLLASYFHKKSLSKIK